VPERRKKLHHRVLDFLDASGRFNLLRGSSCSSFSSRDAPKSIQVVYVRDNVLVSNKGHVLAIHFQTVGVEVVERDSILQILKFDVILKLFRNPI